MLAVGVRGHGSARGGELAKNVVETRLQGGTFTEVDRVRQQANLGEFRDSVDHAVVFARAAVVYDHNGVDGTGCEAPHDIEERG